MKHLTDEECIELWHFEHKILFETIRHIYAIGFKAGLDKAVDPDIDNWEKLDEDT